MSQKTVIIVEDDRDIREVISYIFTGNTYKVELYGTASDFRNKLKEQLPDVIVLDIMLPDGDGLAICDEIKATPATGHIPVILMSANKQEQTLTSCADGFISKPFDIDLFKNKIESLLHPLQPAVD